jgi:hypothetical protein
MASEKDEEKFSVSALGRAAILEIVSEKDPEKLSESARI